MFCVKLSIYSEAIFGGSIHMTLCHDFLNTYKHTFMSERKQMHQSIRVRCMKKNVAFLWHTYTQAIYNRPRKCRVQNIRVSTESNIFWILIDNSSFYYLSHSTCRNCISNSNINIAEELDCDHLRMIKNLLNNIWDSWRWSTNESGFAVQS